VVAESNCVGSNVLLTVQVTNNGTVPMSAVAKSAYGTVRFGSVPVGKQESRSLPIGAASVPAGEVTVAASATVDAEPCRRRVVRSIRQAPAVDHWVGWRP
jgi:arabinoxylan arabinofuranohydrolase